MKRTGRPIKDRPRKRGKRYQLGMLIDPELREFIVMAAKENGHTISQECEMLIHKGLQYEQVFGWRKRWRAMTRKERIAWVKERNE